MEDKDGFLEEALIEKNVKRRCIVFSVCIGENIINQGNNDALTFLLNALVKCQEKLKPDDFVCFNIGSSSHLLTFDY